MYYYISYTMILIKPDSTSCTLHNPCVMSEGLKKIIRFMARAKVGVCLCWSWPLTSSRTEVKPNGQILIVRPIMSEGSLQIKWCDPIILVLGVLLQC